MQAEQLTYPDAPLDAGRRAARFRDVIAREAFVLLAILGVVATLAAAMPRMVVPDTWLALVDGRWIAEHGLPHTDEIGLLTQGTRWVDQQWLAHRALYGLAHLGGVRLVLSASVLVDLLAVAIAAVAARRAGGSPRSTALCLLAAFLVAPWLLQARTQTLALPLFVAVYALLCADGRRPSPRVFLVLPLLVVWANVHGSAALGVALVFLFGLVTVRRSPRRGLLLAVAAPACLVASPYGLDLVGYYRRMLIGSPLPHYIDEWAPTRLELDTIPFFALVFGVVYLLARHRRRVTPFERLALPGLIAVGLLAGRNTGWLGLAFAVSGPLLLDAEWAPAQLTDAWIRRLNVVVVGVAAAVAAVLVATRVTQSQTTLLPNWPAGGATAVATAAGPHGAVLADDVHSDWLLWREPELIGRVAYDVRFELLDASQLAVLRSFREGYAPAYAARYRVLTFSSDADALRSVRSGRDVYRQPGLVVVARRG